MAEKDENNEDVKEVAQAEKSDSTKEKEQSKKASSSHKFLKRFSIIVGAAVIAGILYLAWLGFVPGLSNILGANSPKDLGVTYTEADLKDFYTKTGQKLLDYNDAPVGKNGKKVIFADPKPMNVAFTQEEVTARINASNWAYMPMRNVQVRFGDANRIEVSGNLDIQALAKFIPFIGGVGYSESDVQKGLDWIKKFSSDPAFYIDATSSVSNNNLSLNINSVEVSRWSPPLGPATDALRIATQNSLSGTKGLDIQSATVEDGALNFKGVAPTTIYVKNR